MKVGLDFGTTNSLISYWNEKTENVEIFEYQESVSTPTTVVYGLQDKPIDIGKDAVEAWCNNPDELKLATFFKTNLNKEDKANTAKKYCKDFILNFLKQTDASFESNHGKISELVVSVPELWQKDIKNVGATNLLEAIENTGIKIKQLVSEPLSALAYFCWKNKEDIKENKRVLVCDMGGGTCDVSYCKVRKDTKNKIVIDVIAHDGNQGKAGVYDVKKILTNFYKSQGKEDEIGSNEFKKDIWTLDKIIQSSRVTKLIEKNYPDYLQDSEENNEAVFHLNNKQVFGSDVYSAFPEIEENIGELLDRIKAEVKGRINFDYLLFIGGFSNYFLVRQAVTKYFDLDINDNKVKAFNLNDSKRAVAHGAALIAAEQVDIHEYYPHTIFFEVYQNRNKKLQMMIKSNTLITPNKIVWEDENRYHVDEDGDIPLKGKILKDGKLEIPFDKEFTVDWKGSAKKNCKVGLQISRANTVSLIIHSSCGKYKKEVELGELLS